MTNTVNIWIPKGSHLGAPLNSILEEESLLGVPWTDILASDAPTDIIFNYGRKRGVFHVLRYRPKDMENIPPNDNITITARDKVAEYLSKEHDFNFRDISELKRLLSEQGFDYLMDLDYSPCYIGVSSRKNGNWKNRNPMRVYAEFPYLFMRDWEDPNKDAGFIIRQEQYGPDNPKQKVVIIPVSGSAEALASLEPTSFGVAVVRNGDTLERYKLQLLSILYDSVPVVVASRGLRETYPQMVEYLTDSFREGVERSRLKRPELYEKPGIESKYPQLVGEYNKTRMAYPHTPVQGHNPQEAPGNGGLFHGIRRALPF